MEGESEGNARRLPFMEEQVEGREEDANSSGNSGMEWRQRPRCHLSVCHERVEGGKKDAWGGNKARGANHNKADDTSGGGQDVSMSLRLALHSKAGGTNQLPESFPSTSSIDKRDDEHQAVNGGANEAKSEQGGDKVYNGSNNRGNSKNSSDSATGVHKVRGKKGGREAVRQKGDGQSEWRQEERQDEGLPGEGRKAVGRAGGRQSDGVEMGGGDGGVRGVGREAVKRAVMWRLAVRLSAANGEEAGGREMEMRMRDPGECEGMGMRERLKICPSFG